jgi:hypothetical protein
MYSSITTVTFKNKIVTTNAEGVIVSSVLHCYIEGKLLYFAILNLRGLLGVCKETTKIMW